MPKVPIIGGGGYEEFMQGIMALATAKGRCIKDNTLLAIAAGATMAYDITQKSMSGAKKITSLLDKPIDALTKEAISSLMCVAETAYVKYLNKFSGSLRAQNTVPDFQVNGQNCENTPDYNTGGD